MEVKPGYKHTEVGVIPEDWEVKQLRELFEITSSKRVFQSEWKTEGIPFYRARELAVLGEKGFVNNELFISREMYDAFKNMYGVPKVGDILVTGVGTLGKVYVVSDDREFYFKDGNIIWFKSFGRVRSDFVKQLYLTRLVIKQIEDASAGTTVGTYTISGANKTIIPVPTLAEQTAIAEALSDADALSESLEQLIAKKRQVKQGAMQELLTGKRRLPGFGGEWVAKTFDEICWFQEGPGVRNTQFTTSGVKLLNGTNIFRGVLNLDSTSRFISESEAYGPYAHFLADAGDIVIASSGISIEKFHEKVAVVKESDLPFCMNTSTIRFKPFAGVLEPDFLFQFLASDIFKKAIGGQATGSAQLNFGPSHVTKVIMFLPSLPEQTAIAAIFSDMDAEIAALEAKLVKARQVKQGMMQELLTGRVRLV